MTSTRRAIAAGMLLAAASAMPSHAQTREVSVGIIDVRADSILDRDRNVHIEHRGYPSPGKTSAEWSTQSGFDHGQLVATAFVSQLRRIDKSIPVRIYSANVFDEKQVATTNAYEHSDGGSKRTLSINWDGATKALDWFKSQNVRVVLTSFTSPDSQPLRAFMTKANELGLVVLASAGNKVDGNAFPARYPEAISVAGDSKGIAFRRDPSVSTWVHLVTDGSSPMGANDPDVGSSFAVARAAAYAAYMHSSNPGIGRQDVLDEFRRIAESKSYEVSSQTVQVSYLDPQRSAAALSERTASSVRLPTKGPEAAEDHAPIAPTRVAASGR